MKISLSSIRVRLLCGFIAVIGVFGLAAGVTVLMGERVREADAARDHAFADLGRVALVEREMNAALRLLAAYRISGAGADRDAFLGSLGNLGEHLAEVPGSVPTATLQGASDAAAAVIGEVHTTAGALTGTVGALGNPISTLGEVVGRGGDAGLIELAMRLQGGYAAINGAAGRLVGTEEARDARILKEEQARLRTIATEIESHAAVTPRMRRLAAGIGKALTDCAPVQAQFEAALASRAERSQEIERLFGLNTTAVEAARAAADASFAAVAVAARQAAADQRSVLLAGSGTATLLGLGFALLIGRATTQPIEALSRRMDGMATGALEAVVPGSGRRDEIGAMARSVETFRAGLLRAKVLEAEAEAARYEAEAARLRTQQALAEQVERQLGAVVAALTGSADQLGSSIAALSDGVDNTVGRASAVAVGAGETTTNVQTVAAATEELATSVREITRQVAQAAQVASQAVQEAETADGTMLRLSEAAGRIGEVLRLIGDIAGQTNLLALNATIEAARAGEAGKGFAVVASEVKALAGQTAKATEEISGQISGIQDATARAVQSIKGIARVVGQVDQIAAAIAAAVEQQGSATQEIARNVAEAARGTTEVSANISQVSAGMEANGGELRLLRDATGEVARQGNALRDAVNGLVRGLHAA